MSRLPWSRYEGDDIEAVVSMFVCREFPEAFRVRPSRGMAGSTYVEPSVRDMLRSTRSKIRKQSRHQ